MEHITYRETPGGMQIVTPSVMLRFKNGKLEQLCTFQIMGNGGHNSMPWQDLVAVQEVTE